MSVFDQTPSSVESVTDHGSPSTVNLPTYATSATNRWWRRRWWRRRCRFTLLWAQRLLTLGAQASQLEVMRLQLEADRPSRGFKHFARKLDLQVQQAAALGANRVVVAPCCGRSVLCQLPCGVRRALQVIGELAGMLLGRLEDATEDSPRGGVSVTDLAHEPDVRFDLMSLQHKVFGDHVGQGRSLLGPHIRFSSLLGNLLRPKHRHAAQLLDALCEQVSVLELDIGVRGEVILEAR